MKDSPFNPKIVMLFVICAIALFALSVLLMAYDGGGGAKVRTQRTPAGTHSVSAIGYAGFYETMERMGYPVSRSDSNPVSQTGSRGVLIVLEPELRFMSDNDDHNHFSNARRLLLALPKWQGDPEPFKPQWVENVTPVPLYIPQQTIDRTENIKGTVIREDWPATWSVNEIGITPTGQGRVQLIVSQSLRPIVGNANGMLIGEKTIGKRVIWVLADPDILNNFGFPQGDNAVFTLAVVEKLRSINNSSSRAPIVFDETVHGYKKEIKKSNNKPSGLKVMFQFPFVIITILVCLTALLMALAGTRRFGAPLRAKPNLDFGKAGLIHNGARLLDYAGHHAVLLQRYIKITIRTVGQTLHAPANLSDQALAHWLDRVGKSRKINVSCAKILADTSKLTSNDNLTLAQLFKDAWAIYKWKGEMLNGSAVDRRHS